MATLNGVMPGVSSSLAASIVVKATLIAMLGLIGAWLARGSRAAVRHAVLAASFAVLLTLPVLALLIPPVRIAVRQSPTVPSRVAETIDTVEFRGPTKAGSGTTPSLPQRSLPPLYDVLSAVWMAGAVFFLLRIMTGLRQVHLLRRSGLPWRHGQSIVQRLAQDAGINRHVALLLHESLPAPVTCGVLHPAIVLPPDAQNWEGQDLNRAILHELEHVRRGDWVSHCVARVVCAAYWFHPLVWIASRQFALAAERCCDDAVLRCSDATAYADQLLALAQRLSSAGKSPALAMANRSDLSWRVRAVLDAKQQRGRAGALLVTLACTVAAALVLTLAPLTIVAAPQAASTPSAGMTTPEFDAVSVKLVDPNAQGSHWDEHSDGKYLNITGSIHGFILRTYGIREAQLIGEPEWFTHQLYKIEAVTSAPVTQKQMLLMLRGVLVDRFRLALRPENRELPILALEVSPKGPKFHELKPGEMPAKHATPAPGNYARTFTSMEDLMNQMNGVFMGPPVADRPVVDRTHLSGRYDMHLETERRIQVDDAGNSIAFPNLVGDMQSELGLRLVPERGSLPCFVVEHAASPTPN